MEYRQTELTEWFDKKGRVIKRRFRQHRFYISPYELHKVCNTAIRITDRAARAIVASSRGNRYLLK